MAEVGAVKAACDAVVEHLYGSRAVQVLLASRTSVVEKQYLHGNKTPFCPCFRH